MSIPIKKSAIKTLPDRCLCRGKEHEPSSLRIHAVRQGAVQVPGGAKVRSQELQEKELVVRCLQGDQEAYRALFNRYFDELSRTAAILMKSPADADDVVQETFIRTFQALQSYDLDRPFRPWLHRILLNVCKDVWKRRRWLFIPIESAYDVSDQNAPDPEACFLKDDELRRLAQAIRELSPKHQAVVALYFLNEMRISDVAEAVGVPEGTVKSRLHHAVRALRKRLERSDGALYQMLSKRGEELKA